MNEGTKRVGDNIWLFVPDGAKSIMIKHPFYKPARYEYPNKIESGAVYKMKVECREKNTSLKLTGSRVTSFNNLPNDISARKKGEGGAIIKFQTVEKGFTFVTMPENNAKVDYHTGEIWVSVQEGTYYISIYKEGYEPAYYYPNTIEKGEVYLMDAEFKEIPPEPVYEEQPEVEMRAEKVPEKMKEPKKVKEPRGPLIPEWMTQKLEIYFEGAMDLNTGVYLGGNITYYINGLGGYASALFMDEGQMFGVGFGLDWTRFNDENEDNASLTSTIGPTLVHINGGECLAGINMGFTIGWEWFRVGLTAGIIREELSFSVKIGIAL